MSHERQGELFIPFGHMNLKNDFRLLMLQFTFMQKLYISAVAADHGYSEAILKKWYGVPNTLKEKFQLIFGLKAERCVKFLSMHIMYMVQLVEALKHDHREEVDVYITLLYENAEELAEHLAELNPFWNEVQWKNLLYAHINMFINGIVSIFSENHEKALEIFDRLIMHSLTMGDYMGEGIIDYLTTMKTLAEANKTP